MGYFLGKGTFIKSNYGLSSNVSVFCRCYGYSIVTVLDALDHDPYCGFATNGFQPMLRWFRFVGFLPLLTVTCRCTGFSLATGICRFLRILVALLRVLLRQFGGYTTAGFYRCNDRSLLRILFRVFGSSNPRPLSW